MLKRMMCPLLRICRSRVSLVVAFTAVIVVIFASSAVVYDRLLVNEAARKVRLHSRDVLETLQQALDGMVDQETGVRGYLLVGDEKFLEPYHTGSMAFAGGNSESERPNEG